MEIAVDGESRSRTFAFAATPFAAGTVVAALIYKARGSDRGSYLDPGISNASEGRKPRGRKGGTRG